MWPAQFLVVSHLKQLAQHGDICFPIQAVFLKLNCSFPVGQRINLVSWWLVSWRRGVIWRPPCPPGWVSTGEEIRIAIAGLFPTLCSQEPPSKWGDVVFTHDWRSVALSPTLAFSGAFVAEGERFLTGGLLSWETNSGGSHRGSTFKLVRLENMFAQFISICHPVPNVVQLVHICVEIFLPVACWVIVDELLF